MRVWDIQHKTKFLSLMEVEIVPWKGYSVFKVWIDYDFSKRIMMTFWSQYFFHFSTNTSLRKMVLSLKDVSRRYSMSLNVWARLNSSRTSAHEREDLSKWECITCLYSFKHRQPWPQENASASNCPRRVCCVFFSECVLHWKNHP